MSWRTPTSRPISWWATIPQLAILAAAAVTGLVIASRDGLVVACLIYLFYSQGSRRWIPRAHRAGIRLLRNERFLEAIAKFQESLDFFDRHDWIDRYRAIVLLSPGAMSYREMALVNIAFCYSQIGDGEQARYYYKECLDRFPDSPMALAALRMLDSAQEKRLETESLSEHP